MKQAVVLIHGIGEQKPMSTLRKFVEAVLPPAIEGDEQYWSKPDRMSELFELRRLKARGRTKTDFFEYYWAYHVEGTKLRHLGEWFVGLLFRRWNNIPTGLRTLWIISWILTATFILLAVFGGLSVLKQWQALQTPYGMIALIGVLVSGAIHGFLIYYVGDAARYLSPSPQNIALRQKIRAEGVRLLRQLHNCHEYDRILIVGHSLGSVIAYDIITRLWLDYNRVYDFRTSAPVISDLLAQHRHPQAVISDSLYEAGKALSLRDDPEALLEFRNTQVEGWREQGRWGNPWRVTDFVTIGSPLAHAMLLLASDGKDFAARKLQRELLTCPPVADKQGYGYNDDNAVPVGEGKLYSPYILHHAAAFAVTRWSNLYFPAYLGLFGDCIGGPLRDTLGFGIKDIPVKLKSWRRFTPFSHTAYWKLESGVGEQDLKGETMLFSVKALRCCLALGHLRQFRVEAPELHVKHLIERELRDLSIQMGEAEQQRHEMFFATLLSDTLTFRRSNGTIVGKEAFLKDLMNPANTFDSLESDDIVVEIYEGVATVTLIVRTSGMREGRPFDGVFRNIRIFVREPNKQPPWQLHCWFNVGVSPKTTVT